MKFFKKLKNLCMDKVLEMALESKNKDNPWIRRDEKWPSCDGLYEGVDSLLDKPEIYEYDGYGFKINGHYHRVKYWRPIVKEEPKKKYGDGK